MHINGEIKGNFRLTIALTRRALLARSLRLASLMEANSAPIRFAERARGLSARYVDAFGAEEKMKKMICLALLFLSIGVYAQDIQTTTISIFQKTYNVRFIVVSGDAYINWTEFMAALPGWFTINSSGQIEVSPIVQLAVLRAITESYSSASASLNSTDVIESNIDGEFNGWDGETIFKLTNGQIWQQSTYAYTYHYAYRPKVMIVNNNGRYLMQVEGVSGTIQVKRLK